MAAKRWFTPVRPSRSSSGLVHAFSFHSVAKTLCDRRCSGWVVALADEEVNCGACLTGIQQGER